MKNYNNAFSSLDFTIYTTKEQNKIFADYHERLIYFLLPYCYGNMEVTQDLVSESLTKVLGTKFDENKGASFTTFVYNIAKNVARDYFRIKKLDTTSENNFTNDKDETTINLTVESVEDTFIKNEDKINVSTKLGFFLYTLKDSHRKMFIFKYLKGYSTFETAKKCKVDTNTCKVTLKRTKAKVSDYLNGKQLA